VSGCRGSQEEHRSELREAWVRLENFARNVAWHCVTDGTTFFRSSCVTTRVECGRARTPIDFDAVAEADRAETPLHWYAQIDSENQVTGSVAQRRSVPLSTK
jgi:hypothetical protein